MGGRDSGKGPGVLSARRWGHVAQGVEAEGRLEPGQDRINLKELGHYSVKVRTAGILVLLSEGRAPLDRGTPSKRITPSDGGTPSKGTTPPSSSWRKLLKSKVWPWPWESWLGTCWG